MWPSQDAWSGARIDLDDDLAHDPLFTQGHHRVLTQIDRSSTCISTRTEPCRICIPETSPMRMPRTWTLSPTRSPATLAKSAW